MTRIPLSDFLGGGTAVAPAPKRMKLDDFLSGGTSPTSPAVPAPLSVPFANQPTPTDPLTELLTGGPADPDWMVNQPPAPPVQGIPAVQGVLDNYNLSGYVDPSLKDPPSFEVPDAALTPTGIRNFNERRQAEEQRQAEVERAANEAAFAPGARDAPGEWSIMHRRAKYYETLPYKITADIQSDPATFERYRRLNELATGGPLLDVPAENRPAAQQAISETIASMKANGVDDPVRWMMEIDSFDGPQGIAGRSLSAAWEQTKRSGANMLDAMVDPMGNNTLGTRQRQMEAGWQEGVEDVKDERSLLPNAVNEVARAASQSAPQLAAAAGVGYATKNPALAWATLLGPSGVENFQVGRTNGLTNAEAAGRAVALAGVEYATAKIGGKAAEKLGMKTFEELAFGTATKAAPRTKIGKLIATASEEAFGVGGKAASNSPLGKITAAIGGSTIEGGEEVAAGVAQQFSDFVVGLEDELVGDETPEQLALAFAVGMVASGAMHLPSFANFVQNPTVENAEAAGITEELAPTQVDRESLAAAAAEKMTGQDQAGADFANRAWGEVNAEAPRPPADAIPPDAPIETPLPPEAIQEQPAPPVEPVAEPPRKRRIGERITAPPVTTLTGRAIPSPPQLRPGSGERGVTNDIRKQLQWLLDEGIAEATARGDEFNLQWMQGEKVGSLSKGNGLPPATVDSLNEYLFGETNPSWDAKTGARIDSGVELSSPPPVPAPFTNPLVAPAVDAPVQKKSIGERKPTALTESTPLVAPPDAPPVAPSQAPADSGVQGVSLADLRKEYDDAIKAADAEFAAIEKALGSEKAKLKRSRVKNKAARLEALEEQYRQAKGVRQKRYQESGQKFRELSEKTPERAQEKEKERESLARIRKEQAERDADVRSRREQKDWQEVQDKGGYAAVKAQEEARVRDIEGRLKRTKDQNKFKLESSLRNAKSNLEYIETLNNKFGQTPAPPEQVAEPPKKTIGKRTPPPILKAAEFKQKLKEAAKTPEEGDMLYRLVEAQAEVEGDSVDEYVGKYFADVKSADYSESVYLKQRASGGGDALAQAAPSDRHHIQNDSFKRWAGTDNVVLHAAADLDLEVVYDGGLDVYEILDHTHGEQVGDTYRTEEDAWKALKDLVRPDRYETGKPVVAKVYHGSPAADFQKFDRRKLGENTGARSAKKGFFFAGHPDTANAYNDAEADFSEIKHEGWKFVEKNLLRGNVVGQIESIYDADVREDKPSEPIPGIYAAIAEVDRLSRESMNETDDVVAKELLRDADDAMAVFVEKIQRTLPDPNAANAWGRAYQIWSDTRYGKRTDISPEKLAKWIESHPSEVKEIAEREARRAGFKGFTYSTAKPLDLGGGGSMPVYVRMKNPLVFDYAGGDYTDKPFSRSIQEGIDGGHDGVILQRTYDGGPIDNIFITFDENNIKSAIGNQGTFKNRASILAQKKDQLPRAEVQFLKEDGRAIIRAFRESQDLSSLVHELGHVFRRRLSVEQLAIAETWAGVKNGEWTRAAEEKFARAFERYMREGKAPIEGLRDVFAKFKQWLTTVYKTINGSPLDMEMTPEIRAVMDSLFVRKSIGRKKAAPAKELKEALPDWVTEDDAPTAPALDKKQKNDLNRLRRRFKQKLDKETFDELSGLSEYDQHVVAAEADRRADWANNGIQQLLDSFDGLQTHDMSKIATNIRNILRSGKKDTASIPGFDELLSDVRDNHPSLAAYAESVGNGSVESGLADILVGGRKGLAAKLVGPETEVFDVLEEYRERLERSPEEEGRGSLPEASSGGFESQGGDQEGGRRDAAEAEDFKLSGEGSTDTSPIVEPYKVADKDRLPPKRKTERQPQLDGLPEDLDESVLAGQQGLQFSATTGEQLQPDKPRVIVTPPKSQREIIADLAKTLDIPIRFGRMLHKQAGGTFFRKPNLIALKRANDVPVATHEVGHKLDAMFKLSSDKAVRSELERLGDPNTPGSRSSWTKSKSKSYKLGEGVAEYVRYWMTDPKKAKAEAPNMHAAFEAVLDANKDLGDALRQTQEDIRVWRTAEPQARLRSQISIGDNPNKTRYSLSQLTRDVVDDLHYLKLATEDAKLGDPGLKPSQNPYLLARNLRGSYGMASTFIQSGAVNFTTKDVALGTSLEDALKPVGGRLNDFRDWIVAKRAQELESQGRATGLVKSDIDAVVKSFEGDAEFEKAFADVKKWNDSVLQYSVDAGLVTTESAKAIREMNQDYVPFHRLFEVGANEAPSNDSSGQGSGLNPGKPGSLKRLKGSTRNIVDPLETMVKNAYAIITASEKSAISLAVADMANLPNMGKWVEKVAAPMQPKTVRVDEIIDQLAELGADVEALEKSADVLTFFRQAKKPPKGENTISVVRDGKQEFYRLNRYLHDTFEALDLDDAGKLVRILSAPAQLLRAGVTLEPGFNIANMMRDTFGAAVVGKYGALPFETTLRGIGAIIAKPQLVAEWAAAGGRSSVEANYFDRKKMQKYLAERVSKDLTPAERALIVAKSPLTALRWMSTTFEEATRIGEYEKAFKSLKQSGMTDGEARRLAAFEARDRQDFAKGGAKTKILRHVAAFWNAQLQANVRLAQSFKERPLQTTLKGLAFVTLPKLLEQALNWDDEDYWNRPQWERDVFYMIPIGKDDAGHTRFLRIPVPFEIGIIFATVPGRFLEWAKKNDPEAVKGIPGMFIKQTMPVPNPSGAVTIMEMIPDQGYSYFRGREIVPDSMADMPKDLQWTQQTSTLAKKIGEATGLSPMKVDYFIESTTGGLGKVAMGKQVPGERFVSNPLAVVGQPIADFYDIRQQLTEDAERIKATGEYKGFGPVMLAEFEDAGEKMGAIRNRARETEDPVDKALLEDEAYQIAVKMVQRYRENPSPEESIAAYATRHAERVILSSGRPHRQKRKLGSTEPTETEADYEKRLHEWEAKRKIADEWLKSHKDTPAVQAAIIAAEKDIPAYPQHRGDSDFTYGKRVAEWKSRYGNSARAAKGLK